MYKTIIASLIVTLLSTGAMVTSANDKADLIGVCRQIIRDPEWANKAKDGKSKEIKKCIYCNTCLETAFTGEGGYCKLDKKDKEKEAK